MDSSTAQAEAVPTIPTTTVYTATPPVAVAVAQPVPTPTPTEAVVTAEAPDAPVAATNNAEPTLPSDLSPGLADVIKLVEAKVGDEVVLNYIKSSGVTYHPTAAEIVYLTDLGVSDAVISAILQPAQPGVAAAAPAPEPVAAPVEAPAPVVEAPAPEPAPEPVAEPVPVATPTTTVIVQPAPQPAVTVAYFQQSLSPYGTWVMVPGYGMCWQPAVAVTSPEWQPYCDRGHWVYTDAGWYWESDYSWGWAAFHYGRWWRHGHYGWVWTPDTVWGPSWVCWRNHDAYCGWAPLPPGSRFEVGIGWTYRHARVGADFDFGLSVNCFTFVGYNHFRDHHMDRYRVPRRDLEPVFRHSRVDNHYSMNRSSIVNEGPDRRRIGAASHTEVTPIALHHQTVGNPTGIRRDRVDSTTKSLTVYHPQFNEKPPGKAGEVRPVTINHPNAPAGPTRGDVRPGTRPTEPRTPANPQPGSPSVREPGTGGSIGGHTPTTPNTTSGATGPRTADNTRPTPSGHATNPRSVVIGPSTGTPAGTQPSGGNPNGGNSTQPTPRSTVPSRTGSTTAGSATPRPNSPVMVNPPARSMTPATPTVPTRPQPSNPIRVETPRSIPAPSQVTPSAPRQVNPAPRPAPSTPSYNPPPQRIAPTPQPQPQPQRIAPTPAPRPAPAAPSAPRGQDGKKQN